YGLSNGLLDIPWPKVAQGKQMMAALAGQDSNPSAEKLFDLLQTQTTAPDEALPATGVDLEWERALSPIFITSPAYGTRCSSVLLIDTAGAVRFSERTWRPAQATPRCEDTRHFKLDPRGGFDPLAERT
ncbi:MAG: NRDE family protein, partial [Desulfatitalea sp.]